MIYQYLGKQVEVVRFTANETAQLADGTWVPSAMLHAQGKSETPLEVATKKRANQSETN